MPVCGDAGGIVRMFFLILAGWLPGTGEERIICGQDDGKSSNGNWKEPTSCCDFGIGCDECEQLQARDLDLLGFCKPNEAADARLETENDLVWAAE